MREMLCHTDEYPEKGDKIICLRNNQKQNLFNGQMGVMKKRETPFWQQGG